MMEPAAADRRFERQAEWSLELQHMLFAGSPGRILEVGCGTGAFIRSLHSISPDSEITGIDIDFERIRFAERNGLTVGCADGAALPFSSGSFDLVCCHYLLLWVGDPVMILREMRRVSLNICAAFAEPVYDEMTVSPLPLQILAEKQRSALISRGIDPAAGRMLPEWFRSAGFREVRSGRYRESNAFSDEELDMMRFDAGDPDACMGLKQAYYCIPTSYAFGRV